MRAEHSLALSGSVFLYELLGVGYGATLGIYVGPNTLIEVDGYRATALLPRQTSESVALRIQQFYADIAYVRAGSRLRRVELKKTLSFETYEERTVQSDIGLDVAVGFQVKTGTLQIGLDALGVYLPLGTLSSERQVVDTSNGELLDAEPRDASRRLDVRIAALSLGVCF